MNGFPHDDSSKSRAPLSSVEQGADERPTLAEFAEEELTEPDALSCFAQQEYESAVRAHSSAEVPGLSTLDGSDQSEPSVEPPDLPLNTTTAPPRRTLPLTAVQFSVAKRVALAAVVGTAAFGAYVVGSVSTSDRVVEVQSPRESSSPPRADPGLVTSTEVRIEPKVETAITYPPLRSGNENGASAVSAPPKGVSHLTAPIAPSSHGHPSEETEEQPFLAGEWAMHTRVESSRLRRYEGLRLTYTVQLHQEGHRIRGTGRKISENDRRINPRAQTPIALEGFLNGDRVELTFTEQGRFRPSAGNSCSLASPTRPSGAAFSAMPLSHQGSLKFGGDRTTSSR